MPPNDIEVDKLISLCNQMIDNATPESVVAGRYNGTYAKYISSLIVKLTLLFGCKNQVTGILIMWWVFWALLLFVEFCGVSGLVARHRTWRYNCDHLDEYKSKEKEACKERYAERIRLLQERNEEAIKVERKSDGIYDFESASQIKCPTCGSTHVTRISAGTRMIDGAVFGTLSVEGRAQFRCESCGYKW